MDAATRPNRVQARSGRRSQGIELALLVGLWSCGGEVVATLAGTSPPGGRADRVAPTRLLGRPQAPDPTGALNPAPESQAPAAPAERCDGYDNDGNGEVDEGLDAGSCRSPGGDAGVVRCLDGHMRCVVCEPGEQRAGACDCGIGRVDLCTREGQWVAGVCDGCNASPSVPCGFCGHVGEGGECVDAGECPPGKRTFRRCDTCPEEDGCGADTCVGELVQCNNRCEWEVLEPCRVRQRQCSRDEARTEDCGQCGDVELLCDGCFWSYAECHEHGECFRGSAASVPCGEGCGGYRVAGLRCTDSCTWSEAAGCYGCVPGGPYYAHTGCSCSSALRTVEYYCTLTEAPNACGLSVGVEVGHTVVEECPPVPCYPGQTTAADGLCAVCDENCVWSGWVPCGGPGEGEGTVVTPPPCGCSGSRTESCNDPCGNTRVYECRDCQWILTQDCGRCDH